jgi:hypothetical protein
MRFHRHAYWAGGALAFVVASAGGCGSGAGTSAEPVGHSMSAIQGGTLDTTHNFAVGICGGADGGPAEGQNCQLLCSGALIAPNLIMTARHCVDNVSSDTVSCGLDTFGAQLFPASQYYITTDPEVFDPAATWYQVAEIITPTPTAFCGNDLALMILIHDVDSSVVPTFVIPEIWNPIYSSQYSTEETAIGYGLDAPNDADSAGIRRILEDIQLECIPDDPMASFACAPVSDSGVATNEFLSGNGPCEGDSGSSAYEQNNFAKGIFLSLGVLSRGGTNNDECVGSIYTQLYPWQSLILSTAMTAASMGGYTPPSWTHNPADAVDGGADSGDKLEIGTPCGSGDACESGQCVSLQSDGGGYVCSEACSPSSACPTGYSCMQGYCFGSSTSIESASPSSSGGCSAAPHGSGTGRAPWVMSLGILFWLRRRRRRE